MKIILLTTNTYHHKYLISQINTLNNVELFIFFIHKKNKKFFPKNQFEKKEKKFEKNKFFANKLYNIRNKTYNLNDVNSKKCINLVNKISPDLGILFGTKKLNIDTIKTFNNNLINIHRGIMQKYRGLDSEYWALFNKDYKNIGSTIHYVNKYLDKGQIIYEKKLKIQKKMKCYQLKYYTTKLAVKYVLRLIKLIKGKNKIRTFKNQQVGKYYSHISSNEKKEACKNLLNYTRHLP